MQHITTAEVARILDVTERHVLAMTRAKRLPRPLKRSRPYRWKKDELEAWVAQGLHKPKPRAKRARPEWRKLVDHQRFVSEWHPDVFRRDGEPTGQAWGQP